MKQNNKKSKLSLSTQTVRALSSDEMNQVAGGTVYNWTTIAWTFTTTVGSGTSVTVGSGSGTTGH